MTQPGYHAPRSTHLTTLSSSVALVLALLACKKSEDDSAQNTPPPPPTSTTANTPSAPDCPARFRELAPAQIAAGTIACRCPGQAPGGSVWGTDVYTTDSNVCAAAIHAGALTAAGGQVTLKTAPGCSAYVGSARNGVSTSGWGSYQSSFYFDGKGNGQCADASALAGKACPPSFKAIPGRTDTTTLTCECAPTQMTGSVWGSGVYTTDSSLCRAAVHAGAITMAGGTITVKASGGCAKYKGSTRNGVNTGKWGAYDSSFYVDGKGDGKCP